MSSYEFAISDKPAKLHMRIAVGFGDARITRDGETVYSEDDGQVYDDGSGFVTPSLWRFERMAAIDPNHDWRCILYAPTWGEVWQRQGRHRWMLIERNEGFA